jgi:ATP-dependent helicase HrpB
VVWDWQAGRVSGRDEERLGAMVLASRPCAVTDDEAADALIAALGERHDLSILPWSVAARQLQARAALLRRFFPADGWPDLSDEALLAVMTDWLRPYLRGITSLAALAKLDLSALLQGQFTWEQKSRLNEGAPTHLTMPSGSRLALDYLAPDGPVLAVKLQELFGCGQTPQVAWGRCPVLLHLLSPAGRPIQVTRDLANFWNVGYPEVKKELKGRYPKHPWPDDPWSAVPTPKTSKGLARERK